MENKSKKDYNICDLGKNTQKNYTKGIFLTQIITMMWSLTQSQTSWNAKSSGPLYFFIMKQSSGGDEIPVELFQILNGDAVKVLHLICQQIWKTQQWPQEWKRSVFIPIPKKGNAKECSNYCTVALISHPSKVMLKILQARLQQYVNHELPDIQVRFTNGRGNRDQIGNICWIMKKEESSRKTSTSALLTTPKRLTVWITTNSGKFLKRWEYQTTLPVSSKTCMQIKKQQLEPDMEQWTGS